MTIPDHDIAASLAAGAETIVGEIAVVGDVSRQAMRRYEGVFAVFRQELARVLAAAASMGEAAGVATILTDITAEALRSHFPATAGSDCKAGCNSCCRLFVGVPPGSAALIADHVRSRWSGKERRALRHRLADAASALEALANPLQARIRCPLLGDDGGCLVYEVRPLACRAFTSRSAARCHTVILGSDPSSGEGVAQNPSHYRLHREATLALEEEARARGLDGRQRGLVHALLDELSPEEG